jgi:hypothetical protein
LQHSRRGNHAGFYLPVASELEGGDSSVGWSVQFELNGRQTVPITSYQIQTRPDMLKTRFDQSKFVKGLDHFEKSGIVDK